MGQLHSPKPVLLIAAVFSAVPSAFDWVLRHAESRWGRIALKSEFFYVEQFTGYYTPTMGEHVPKQIWAFENPIDPAELPQIKCLTNRWEEEFKSAAADGIERPLNIDPGYVDLGKLILASTKDHAHRIYLSDGIFAETTLMYTQKQWKALPWSYPDYQSPACQQFLSQCRNILKSRREMKEV